MNLHEYQAKALLATYGLPVASGTLISTPQEAAQAFEQLGRKSAVIKAQIHAGGRGKAGGIRMVTHKDQAAEVAEALLGQYLVTGQTDFIGQPVHQLLICPDLYPVERELYLGAVIDRALHRIVWMGSSEGGMDIEEVAQKMPEKIIHIQVDPLVGLQPYQARSMGFKLGLSAEQIRSLEALMIGAYKAFIENDFTLFEINPLVLCQDGLLVGIDAKITIDDNALYRHPQLAALRDRTQENEREAQAVEYGLQYVALEGNIGCIVNGAGLAMATMDMIKLKGGNPANFLDVGGSATQARVVEAFKLILADSAIRGVFINIFGGIVHCDMIAKAIIAAIQETKVAIPIVVRLQGNNADLGLHLLAEAGLDLILSEGLNEAAEKMVAAVRPLHHCL